MPKWIILPFFIFPVTILIVFCAWQYSWQDLSSEPQTIWKTLIRNGLNTLWEFLELCITYYTIQKSKLEKWKKLTFPLYHKKHFCFILRKSSQMDLFFAKISSYKAVLCYPTEEHFIWQCQAGITYFISFYGRKASQMDLFFAKISSFKTVICYPQMMDLLTGSPRTACQQQET